MLLTKCPLWCIIKGEGDEKGMNKIKVIDSPCGFGKSSYAIQYINSLDINEKVIYITPFLSEVERIRNECRAKRIYTPSAGRGAGSKMRDLIQLIREGKNIASTHALFTNINDELIEALKENNYILILDEVINVINKIDMYGDNDKLSEIQRDKYTKEDIDTMIKQNIISVAADGLVTWNSEDNMLNKYSDLKSLADRGLVYYISNALLIWTFPVEIFFNGIFKDIFILTYEFENQIQAYYYRYFGVEYEKYIVQSVGDRYYKLLPYDENPGYDLEWRDNIKGLIHICDKAQLNKIGSYKNTKSGKNKTALSAAWYAKANPEDLKQLSNNVNNYFRNYVLCKNSEEMWTTYKEYKTKFTGKNIAKDGWVECGCRATNQYSDKTELAYLVNRYYNPFYSAFFSHKGIKIDNDAFALNEMIQWIFRSAIRNGKPIDIYIPSERMRKLLIEWLNGANLGVTK